MDAPVTGYSFVLSGQYNRRRAWLLAMLSGALLAMSFPPFPFYFLGWIALAPLIASWWLEESPFPILGRSYAAFLLMALVSFSWPLFHEIRLTALASITGVLLFPLLMAIPFWLSSIVKRRLGRVLGMTSLAVFFMTYEHLISRGHFAFPWALLGHTQAEALLFNQFADVTGTGGLTLWILSLNLASAGALLASLRTTRIRFAALFSILLLASAAYSIISPQNRLHEGGGSVRVGLVQPGTPAEEWADVHSGARVATLLEISDSLLSASDPHLVVWPETALPVLHGVSQQDGHIAQLQNWSAEREVSLLTGAIVSEREHFYNSALTFSPDAPLQRYDKVKLVPFAEAVPYASYFRALSRLSVYAGGVSGYMPGDGGPVMDLSDASFGVLICFESLFGTLARKYILDGADFLVVISQDGWWGDSFGYRQHNAFNRLRAIETRRPVVQVTVSGITTVHMPDGRSQPAVGWMQSRGVIAEVPVSDMNSTVYTRIGDVVGTLAVWISLVIGLVTVGISVGRPRRFAKRLAPS